MAKMAWQTSALAHWNEYHSSQTKASAFYFIMLVIFDTLPDTGGDNDYDTAVAKLNEYFSPQTNIAYEVFNFPQSKQNEDESLDTFHTRLRQLAKTCEFSDINKEIKEHIILTCTSSSLRRRALRENLSLENLLKLGRALELSEKQAKQVEKTDSGVHRIKKRSSFPAAQHKLLAVTFNPVTVTQLSLHKQAH